MASSHPFPSLPCAEHPSPPIVISDCRLPPLPSRSQYGAKLASLTIAAATMAGVQLIPFESVAMATTSSVVDTAIERGAVVTHRQNPEDRRRLNLWVPPVADQDYAIGYGKGDTMSESEGKGGMTRSLSHHGQHGYRRSSKFSGLKCPKWTPSELELIMPNLQGPPKPFPKKGHQWAAVLVDTGMRHELFLHVFRDGMNTDEPLTEEMVSGTKTKENETFICFTM